MTAQLKVNSALIEYSNGKRIVSISTGKTVRLILSELNIPSDLVALVLANGEAVDKEYLVEPNDQIEIHPIIGGG